MCAWEGNHWSHAWNTKTTNAAISRRVSRKILTLPLITWVLFIIGLATVYWSFFSGSHLRGVKIRFLLSRSLILQAWMSPPTIVPQPRTVSSQYIRRWPTGLRSVLESQYGSPIRFWTFWKSSQLLHCPIGPPKRQLPLRLLRQPGHTLHDRQAF